MESDSEGDGEDRGGSLVGFLFGNVDRDMQLEDDYMDEVSCADQLTCHVPSLLDIQCKMALTLR